MTDLERKYIIPLRKEWLKVPRYKRSKKSIIAISEFCKKHMKSDDVKIGKNLNLLVWSRGMKNPPHKVEVDCLRKTNEKICHLYRKSIIDIKMNIYIIKVYIYIYKAK